MAIRLAIGSNRWNILRGILTEAIVVSVAGGIVGTLLAAILLQALSRWKPFPESALHIAVLPDAKVYVVALLLSVGSGILFGILPARQVWRSDAAQAMKSSSGTAATFRRFALRFCSAFRLRSALSWLRHRSWLCAACSASACTPGLSTQGRHAG